MLVLVLMLLLGLFAIIGSVVAVTVFGVGAAGVINDSIKEKNSISKQKVIALNLMKKRGATEAQRTAATTRYKQDEKTPLVVPLCQVTHVQSLLYSMSAYSVSTLRSASYVLQKLSLVGSL